MGKTRNIKNLKISWQSCITRKKLLCMHRDFSNKTIWTYTSAMSTTFQNHHLSKYHTSQFQKPWKPSRNLGNLRISKVFLLIWVERRERRWKVRRQEIAKWDLEQNRRSDTESLAGENSRIEIQSERKSVPNPPRNGHHCKRHRKKKKTQTWKLHERKNAVKAAWKQLKAAESWNVRGAFSSFQSTRGFHDVGTRWLFQLCWGLMNMVAQAEANGNNRANGWPVQGMTQRPGAING